MSGVLNHKSDLINENYRSRSMDYSSRQTSLKENRKQSYNIFGEEKKPVNLT